MKRMANGTMKYSISIELLPTRCAIHCSDYRSGANPFKQMTGRASLVNNWKISQQGRVEMRNHVCIMVFLLMASVAICAMLNQVQFVCQTAAVSMACGLIAILLPGFAATLYAQTVDPKSVLGDTTMPSPEDVSQNFPYGITGRRHHL